MEKAGHEKCENNAVRVASTSRVTPTCRDDLQKFHHARMMAVELDQRRGQRHVAMTAAPTTTIESQRPIRDA